DAVPLAERWRRIERLVGGEPALTAAVATVVDLAPAPDAAADADAARRAELVKRYGTVRPFLPRLPAAVRFRAARGGRAGPWGGGAGARRSSPGSRCAGRRWPASASPARGSASCTAPHRRPQGTGWPRGTRSTAGPTRCASWSTCTTPCAGATSSPTGRTAGA